MIVKKDAFGRVLLWIGWEKCMAWWRRPARSSFDRPANGGRMTSIALERTHTEGGDPNALRSKTSKVGKTRYDES